MNVAVVGASAAGLYATLLLSSKHPDWHFLLLEGKAQIGKKLLATGNGHCNLLPGELSSQNFNHPKEFESFAKGRALEDLKDALHQLGIPLTQVNGLYYPASYHAPTFVSYLESLLKNVHIDIFLNMPINDYENVNSRWIIHGQKVDFCADILIFATGGCASPSLGSNGKLHEVFERHGHVLTPKFPGLAPIKTKESTAKLAGIRHRAKCILMKGDECLGEETGELLFKKDGLSGICIFNLESIWARAYCPKECEIVLDLFPEMQLDALASVLDELKQKTGERFLSGLFVEPLAKYVLEGAIRMFKETTPLNIAKVAKHLVFHPIAPYPFEDAQVTVGGIDLNEIGLDMQSKKEKGVYFLGECLDMDGLCGGNNLAWCLISALNLEESL